MEEALEALENAPEDAEIAELEIAFNDERDAHDAAVASLERAEALEEAKRNLPVEPAETDADPALAERTGDTRVTNEPLTYDGKTGRSMLRDLYSAKYEYNMDAQERIRTHGKEMAKRGLAGPIGPDAQERAISTTDGSGGEFVPPVWLQEEWIKLPRAARPIANTLNRQPLPPGTDTINIPKVTAGTAVAVQTDGGAVQSTDLTTGSVTGAVQTIAGQQDVSQQLVDLSVPGIDVVIFDDLTRAYDTQLDTKVISGTVTNAKGLDQLSGTNSRTYTDSTPTVPEFYPKVAGSIGDVNTGIFRPPNVIAMTPLHGGVHTHVGGERAAARLQRRGPSGQGCSREHRGEPSGSPGGHRLQHPPDAGCGHQPGRGIRLPQ